MKKLILLFMLAALALGVSGQDKNKVINRSVYYFSGFSYGTGDNLTETDSLYNIQVLANKAEPLKYDITFEIDSVSGTPATEVKLQGKVFQGDAWTDITTVNWTGTTADTTIVFSEQSTAKYFRYFNIALDMDGTAGNEALITGDEYKFWDK